MPDILRNVSAYPLGWVKTLYETIKAAGTDAGKEWGGSFLETVGGGVSPELVDILAGLVTPIVEGNLNRNATMTGADS